MSETLFRTERDSLGEIQVPADALYGPQTQRAVENFPITGQKPYRAFVWSMALIKRRAAEGLRRLGIGGTATGTGLNAHREYHPRMVKVMTQVSGLQLYTSDNLFESMQSMADMADFSASLRTLAITLVRIANDLRLLSSGPSTGFDEIRLPAVQPGASIMPGKVNPVLAEMLDMAMFH